jgi:signal transduction histidine kinase
MFLNTLERKAADERLAALMRSKDDLIASVSHELRTPLTTVLGLAEELRTERDLSLDERRQLLGYIVEQSRDLSHLVEDLLVASRVDTGQLKVAVEQISLREQVDQTLGSVPTAGRSARPPMPPPGRRPPRTADRSNRSPTPFATAAPSPVWRPRAYLLLVRDDGPGIPEPEQGPCSTRRGPRVTGPPGSLGLGLSCPVGSRA